MSIMLRAMGLLLALAASADAAEPTVYANVNLIDGTGAALKPGMAIVVRDGRIVAVEPMSAVKPGTPAKDMHGAYALPGLINSHVHLATSPNLPFAEAILRRDVYSGVTAVRDMAGDARELGFLAREALIGGTPAPDVYYAALMAGPEFFKDPRTVDSTRGLTPGEAPWMRAITAQTNMPLAIAEAKGTGATAIKIYADLPAKLVDAIASEAHRQHLLVWAHAAVFPASPRDVIESGADVVSHVCMLAYQASASMPRAYHGRAAVEAAKFAGDSPVTESLFAQMKRRGTILDATLWVYEAMWKVKNAQPPPYCSLALAEKLAGEAYRAGVSISAGTDGESEWNAPYNALGDEMAYLVHGAGMSPMDAIRAATLIGARTIGQENDMGTIAPGKLANIVFLKKNPLADIANIKTVTLTLKRGHEFPRRAYKPIAKDEAKGEM